MVVLLGAVGLSSLDLRIFPFAFAVLLSLPALAADPSPAVAGVAQEVAPDRRGRVLSKVTLNDDQTITGYIVRQDPKELEVELVSGGRVILSASSVREIKELEGASVDHRGQLRRPDPSRTRYFYGPSAMMLKQGEGYFSQKELFFSSLAYGLTDHLSVEMGSVVPAWFFGLGWINVSAGVKAGGSINEYLHFAAGAQGLVIPGFTTGMGPSMAGFVFATGTLGTPTAHLTVSAGLPFSVETYSSLTGGMILTISGNYRLTPNMALVTENWILAAANPFTTIDGIGIRVIVDQISVDLGGVWIFTPDGPLSDAPLPWVDFTYNFG
jgi:hypothetical protein